MKEFELDVNQLIDDLPQPTLEVFEPGPAEISQNIFVPVIEYKHLLDIQTRFFMARKYIESCKKYSLDREVLNMIFEIDLKEGEE